MVFFMSLASLLLTSWMKLDEDLGCDLRQRTEMDKVHVGTALCDHQACLWQRAMSIYCDIEELDLSLFHHLMEY